MTLEQEMLALYIQAEKDVLAGKSITFRGETMNLEDLDAIREGRKEWERKVSEASRSRRPFSLSSFN
jgi:hypothetical protein